MNIIKQFILFLKTERTFKEIELTDEIKRKISIVDKEDIDILYKIFLSKLSREMIREDLSPEYIRGAKFSLHFFKSLFVNNIKNGK